MARSFMRVVGIILVLVGLVGFVEPFNGIFNLTPMHDVVHLLTGAVALAVSGSEKASRIYAWIFGVVYLIVAATGLLTANLLGMIPLKPADDVLHLVLGIAGLVVAYMATQKQAHTRSSAA